MVSEKYLEAMAEAEDKAVPTGGVTAGNMEEFGAAERRHDGPCKACDSQSLSAEEIGDEQRKDDGKLMWDLIPEDFLVELADLYTKGAHKYTRHGWRKGMDWSRCIAPLRRHLSAWLLGETHCPRDGQHHLVAVVWNAIALWWYEQHGRGNDDRADTPFGALAEGERVKVAPEIGRFENIRFMKSDFQLHADSNWRQHVGGTDPDCHVCNAAVHPQFFYDGARPKVVSREVTYEAEVVGVKFCNSRCEEHGSCEECTQ
jgi:hypothetical protein